MKKYIIMGVKNTGEKMYARYRPYSLDFMWCYSHEIATHYEDYEIALIDWNFIIKHHSDNFKRIFIPIYDINEAPWNE